MTTLCSKIVAALCYFAVVTAAPAQQATAQSDLSSSRGPEQPPVVQAVFAKDGYILISGAQRLEPKMLVDIEGAGLYRIERKSGSTASAIPANGRLIAHVGAAVRLSDSNPEVSFPQDAPLASRAQVRNAMSMEHGNDAYDRDTADVKGLLEEIQKATNGAKRLSDVQANFAAMAMGLDPQELRSGLQNRKTGSTSEVESTHGSCKSSFSAMSQADQQSCATNITSICRTQCSTYTSAAQSGGMRASYEAAACTYACFANNVPPDYPQRQEYRSKAREALQMAKSLGSNAMFVLAP